MTTYQAVYSPHVPAHRPDRPKAYPVFLITVGFGLLLLSLGGVIAAGIQAGRANAFGYSMVRYWFAWIGGVLTNTLIWFTFIWFWGIALLVDEGLDLVMSLGDTVQSAECDPTSGVDHFGFGLYRCKVTSTSGEVANLTVQLNDNFTMSATRQ